MRKPALSSMMRMVFMDTSWQAERRLPTGLAPTSARVSRASVLGVGLDPDAI
jgi:hypothetical protein